MGVKINEINLFASIVVAGVSLLLFIISILSFSRIRETKILLIGLSFLVFFIKSILIIFLKYYKQSGYFTFFDLLIIFFLYIAAAKK